MYVKEEEVKICLDFLKNYKQYIRKTVNRNRGSYSWKHAVENWTHRETGIREYVSEDSFIEAVKRTELIAISNRGRGIFINLGEKAHHPPPTY